LIPCISGDRNHRGSYRRGEPQNTRRPHDVTPNAKYVGLLQ
jgi:hypothetical protein